MLSNTRTQYPLCLMPEYLLYQVLTSNTVLTVQEIVLYRDQKKHKNTYTSINGMEASVNRLKELTDNAVEALAPYYDNAEFFRNLVLELEDRKK